MTSLASRKFTIIFVMCCGWMLAVDTGTSYACSYGITLPSTLAGIISNFDYVVKAHVVEQDDANQNAIIQVESYLAGGAGPEFLLLNRNEPDIARYILNGRSNGADCLGLFRELPHLEPFYAFVSRDDDGSYHASIRQFNTPHSTVEVYLDGGVELQGKYYENLAEYDSGIEVTENEFVELIAQESGETPTTPDLSYRYPLKTPLLITTQSDEYVLSVDWQLITQLPEPIYGLDSDWVYHRTHWDSSRCIGEDCLRISPDRLNVAMIQDDDTLIFIRDTIVDGQELLFASTSDAVAVWNNCDINIYTTGYPRLNQEWYQLEQVNSLTLDADDCKQHHAQATWTPDGRRLAYRDDSGIWLWDVYTANSEPVFLLQKESETSLTPNHFSPMGRYLNFSRDDVRKHLDIVSGEIIADGLISPDDRLLINYEQPNGKFGYSICSLTTEACSYNWQMYLSMINDETGELERVYEPSVLHRAEWIDKFSFRQVACVADEPDICSIYTWRTTFDGWYVQQIGHGFDFAYDNNTDTIAILKDAHTVRTEGVDIDTSQWFDEEIMGIEWLPSLFYYDD